MDSQRQFVLEVFDKMINGELEESSEVFEFLQEEIRERLRDVILTLDLSDYPFNDEELKEKPLENQEKVEIVQEKLEQIVQEIVVCIKQRPVIYIYDNKFQITDFAIGQEISSSIKSALEKAQTENILEKAIKATCKISHRAPGESLQHIGTGWLIAKNIIVTNSHVVSYLATGDDKKPSFKRSGQEVFVDFIAEYNQQDDEHNPKKAKFKVENVLYAYSVQTPYQSSRYPDIAFLQVSDKSETPGISLPAPISLLENPVVEDSDIVVVGYPGEPTDNDKKEIRKEVSIDEEKIKSGVKVLQPGRIVKALDPNTNQIYSDQRIGHDCTTFGGNSGSILVDLNTGKAVGLHFGGTRYNSDNKNLMNFAVPVETIKKVAKEIGLDI